MASVAKNIPSLCLGSVNAGGRIGFLRITQFVAVLFFISLLLVTKWSINQSNPEKNFIQVSGITPWEDKSHATAKTQINAFLGSKWCFQMIAKLALYICACSSRCERDVQIITKRARNMTVAHDKMKLPIKRGMFSRHFDSRARIVCVLRKQRGEWVGGSLAAVVSST